jgi:hypothetical protein
VVHEAYRRSLIRRFPYAVSYEYAEATVTIYAVFHTSRDPQKWRQRLPAAPSLIGSFQDWIPEARLLDGGAGCGLEAPEQLPAIRHGDGTDVGHVAAVLGAITFHSDLIARLQLHPSPAAVQ